MARGGGVDITGNDAGQGFTSTSTCTHVQAIRVSAAVLRRYDADVPPTAVGAYFRTRPFGNQLITTISKAIRALPTPR